MLTELGEMYYEEYDGQETNDFKYIGVVGETPVPITDPDSQVIEFERIYGDRPVLIYKEV